MSKPSSSHPTNLKSVSKIWPWSNLLASPPLMNVYPPCFFFGSCFCFEACNSDVKCTSQAMCMVALLCHMEVSIAIVIMGLTPWLWMVSFMENPRIKSINGWELGLPPWLWKPPHVLSDSILQECREPQRIDQRQCIWKPEFLVHLEVHCRRKSADLRHCIWDTASNNLYDCFICFSMSTSLEGEQFLPPFPRQKLLRSKGFIAMICHDMTQL